MTKDEIRKFVDKYDRKKWYYYYNFDGIKVRPELKSKKDSGLNNWKKISPLIYDIMNQYSSPSVLDVGCNMGLYAREICKQGGSVVGIDRNVDQALFFQKYVKENLREEFGAKFMGVDATSDEIARVADCDIITMFCVIYHLVPHHEFVVNNLPDHKLLIVQGNTRRIQSKKRKNKALAGIPGISSLLEKSGYKVKSYFKDYSKPIVVGEKI